MAETGIAGFSTPGSLDPRAEEFRPRNHTCPNHQLVLLGPPLPPPQLYYPYGPPYHPPPPPPPPPPPIGEVHVLPFGDGGSGYPQQFSSTPGYVGGAVAVCVPVPAMSSVSTRAVLLSSVPCEVSESFVRRELEAFGEVRGVQMERLCDGIVTVHFYDLRHAESALREIRDQHMQHQTRLRNYHLMMSTSSGSSIATTNTTTATNPPLMIRSSGPEDPNLAASLLFPPVPPPAARGLLAGRAVWAHFVIPTANSIPDCFNQGTIVIFNLDSEVTTSTLKDTFQVFGPIKELRETPSKKHQKFVEFFDVRDAAKALKEMNGKQINGKEVVIEFSRPGGHSRKIMNAVTTTTHEYPPSPPLAPSLATRKLSGRPSFSMNIPPRSYASHAHAPFPARKSGIGKGNGSKGSSSTMSSVERKMASLNLGPSVCNGSGHHHHRERVACHGLPSKRFTRKTQNTTTKASHASSHHSPPPFLPVQAEQPQQQVPPLRSRSKKVGKQGKKFDSRFLISEDTMTESNCRDTRTTVMIKNIPNKYSQKLLLNMLDNHCIHCNEQIAAGDGGSDQPFSSYDFGLEALKEHFKNSKFPCEMDHYLPVVFTPPRDGRQLTEPFPIVGQSKQLQTIPVDHDHHDGGILGGQDDDDDEVVEEDDNNDVFDGSNNDDDDVGADQAYQLLMMGHENSTGCSSLNGGVVLMSGVYNNDVNDDGDDDDQDRRQREIYMF
ncbi:Splicing factor-like protein [Parasponia andersonii]|uniref:Splicing factor-like protein n=1 Tax=Parasponia andersonii TaxID=3476 RepID=A0A2P5B0N9_PARAD|nr:Splicing factor-like protein [Parasponia andersonii]